MTTKTEVERRKAVMQALANARLEGFEPDAEYLALLDRYVLGELPLSEVMTATNHKYLVRGGAAERF
jgi:hypothetical protein